MHLIRCLCLHDWMISIISVFWVFAIMYIICIYKYIYIYNIYISIYIFICFYLVDITFNCATWLSIELMYTHGSVQYFIEFRTCLIFCCATLSHLFLSRKSWGRRSPFSGRKQALNQRRRKRIIATDVDAVPKKVVAPREELHAACCLLGLRIPGAKKEGSDTSDELDVSDVFQSNSYWWKFILSPHLWYILISGSTLKLLYVHFRSVSLKNLYLPTGRGCNQHPNGVGSSSGKVKNGNRQCLENIFLTALASNVRLVQNVDVFFFT